MRFKAFSLNFILLILSGCNGTYLAYYDTLKIAFSDQVNINMTLDEVRRSNVDLMSIKLGEENTAVMALAFKEKATHKWVSNNNTMLIMDSGRLVRTVGLKTDLLYLSNRTEDPLKTVFTEYDTMANLRHWSYSIDLSGDLYGHSIQSTFEHPTQQKIRVFEQEIKTTLYVENMTYSPHQGFPQSGYAWQNYFWFNQKGKLIKSIQRHSPGSEPFLAVYLSRIAREIN